MTDTARTILAALALVVTAVVLAVTPAAASDLGCGTDPSPSYCSGPSDQGDPERDPAATWDPNGPVPYAVWYRSDLDALGCTAADPCVRAYPCPMADPCTSADWVAPRLLSSYCAEAWHDELCGPSGEVEGVPLAAGVEVASRSHTAAPGPAVGDGDPVEDGADDATAGPSAVPVAASGTLPATGVGSLLLSGLSALLIGAGTAVVRFARAGEVDA